MIAVSFIVIIPTNLSKFVTVKKTLKYKNKTK